MELPKSFGRFEVDSVLGRGAMGVVYLANDPLLHRQVAIKVIQAHPGLSDEEISELSVRFEAEARAAGSLSHPNLVTIFDAGQEDASFYIAMEYVRGESLEAVLQAGRMLTYKEISDLAIQICTALDYAHGQGIVHRDIKPANIMITRAGYPRITDFGIARQATSTLTRTGTVKGTPAYMAPEQITGHEVTGRADQFSMGIVLFEMVTGRRPFEGDSPTTTMYNIVHEEPRLPRSVNKKLPGEIDAALIQALHKDPADRYENCLLMAEAVRRALGASRVDAAELLSGGSLESSPPAAAAQAGAAKPPDSDDGADQAPERSPSLSQSLSGVAEFFGNTLRAAVPSRLSAWVLGAIGAGLALGALGVWLVAGGSGAATGPGEAGALETAETPGDATIRDAVDNPEATGLEVPDTGVDAAAGAGLDTVPVMYTIETNYDPSQVFLDGQVLASGTPLQVELTDDREYEIRIEKEGYDPVSWRFATARLTEEQRRRQSLYFPLQPIAPSPEVTNGTGEPVAAEAPDLVPLESLNPVRVRGNISAPRPIEAPVPDYPDWAADQGLREYVVLELVIDAAGWVRNATAISDTHPELVRLAVDAARQWSFQPALDGDGEPVAVRHNATVQFTR